MAKPAKKKKSPAKKAPARKKAVAKKTSPGKVPAKKAAAKKSSPGRNFRKLSNVEHVRMRTGMWLGQNSHASVDQHFFLRDQGGHYSIEHDELEIIPAVWKCLDEACMNCIDEYNKNLNDRRLSPRDRMNKLEVVLSDDQRTITVRDNGRGIPAENAEGVFLHLMYGENFDDLLKKDHVAGQNGVGISLVRMVSEYFHVRTAGRGQEYQKTFTVVPEVKKTLEDLGFTGEQLEGACLHFDENGNFDQLEGLSPAAKTKLEKAVVRYKMKETIKACPPARHGTEVTFRLNPKYFNDLNTGFDLKLIRQYLQDLAMTNAGLSVVFEHKKEKTVFKFKKGLEEIFLNSDMAYFKLAYKDAKGGKMFDLNAFIVLGQNKSLTWVNSNFASLGGSSIEYLENRICDEVRKKPTITALEKKLKTSATRNDVRNCFHMYIDLRVLNPRFKSQDKSYLINDLKEEVRLAVEKNLDKLIRKLDLLNEVKRQMEKRTQLKALEDAEKGLRRAKRENIPKLIAATDKGRADERILFIAEGDSAIAGLRPARNPRIHGLFPLRGKPLNVKGMSLAKAMANEEIKNIVAILGLPLNKKVEDPSELKYQKISIITDADFDGYAIRSLMLSFFFEFWPELFTMKCINITTAPLYEVEIKKDKEKQKIFCLDDEDYDRKVTSQLKKGWELTRKKRNKGLGESSLEAMKYAVDECMVEISITNMKKAAEVQNLWFHKSLAADRRKAISAYAGTIYDEN